MSNISVVDKNLCFTFVLHKADSIENATEEMKIAYACWKDHVDNLTAKIINCSDCIQLVKTTLTKKQVFIFEVFEGPAFEHIKDSKSLLIGARCLTSCLVEDITVPFIVSPILNMAMRNMIITPSGTNIEEKERIKKLVNYMGGQYLDILTANCTHLVANTVKSVKYEKAGAVHLNIMHPDWVADVFDRSQRENILASSKEFDRHRLPIFYGLCITSTSLTNEEKNKVKEIIETNGGKYMGSFKSELTHILILEKDKTDSPKFTAAMRFHKDCVTPQWIYDSVQSKYSLPMANYKVAAIKVSTPTKVGQTPNASQFNPDCTQLSEISHLQSKTVMSNVNETVFSLASSGSVASTRRTEAGLPGYKAVIQRLDVQKAKNAGPILDGCNIYLCGFENEEKELLNKILNNGGATRFDEADEQVSHVIVGEPVASQLMAVKNKNLNPFLLRLEWLEACFVTKHLVAEEPFLISEKSNTQKEPEPPSPASKKNLLSMNHSFKRPTVPKLNFNDNPSPVPENGPNKDKDPQEDLMLDYLNGGAAAAAVAPAVVNPMAIAASDDSKNTSTMATDAYTDESVPVFLEGKILYLEGFPEENHKQLIEDCEIVGGQLVDEKYKNTVDYVIVPLVPNEGVLVKKYRHMVNILWLEDAMIAGAIIEIKYYHMAVLKANNQPFLDMTIVISGYSGFERDYLQALCKSLGGILNDQYMKKQKPVLVCSSAQGAKYQAALKWKFPVVTAQWLEACRDAKNLVDMGPFVVGDAVTGWPNATMSSKMLPSEISPPSEASSSAVAADVQVPSQEVENLVPAQPVQCDKPAPHAMSPGYIQRLLATPKEAKRSENLPLMTSTPAVARHKRLAELNPQTPETPVQQSNISELVADLPTPNRSFVKKVLIQGAKERESKRLNQLLATPAPGSNSDISLTTPELPEFLRTPKEKWGWRDDASPRNHRMARDKFEVMDRFYIPTAHHSPSPRLGDMRRGFWKRALGDKFNDTDDMLKSPEIKINDPEQPKPVNLKKRLRIEEPAPVLQVSPVVVAQPNLEKEVPIQKVESAPCSSKAGSSQAGVHRLNDFIQNIRDDGDDIAVGPHNSEALDYESGKHGHESEVFGWHDQMAAEARRMSKGRSQKPVFAFSNTAEEVRVKLSQLIIALKGELCEGQNFEPRCTHILSDKPSRGEKIFAGIAAGKWMLSSKYIEDSAAARHFLDEEDYEWGNPKTVHLGILTGIEREIANAGYRWRKTIANDFSFKAGAFSKFRVILMLAKHEQFSRLLRAGGGVILDVSPPYEGCSEALTATHCFVDQKKNKLTKSDQSTLRDHNIPVMSIMYLNSWLTSENPEPMKFMSE